MRPSFPQNQGTTLWKSLGVPMRRRASAGDSRGASVGGTVKPDERPPGTSRTRRRDVTEDCGSPLFGCTLRRGPPLGINLS
jgi:hypothetical protein